MSIINFLRKKNIKSKPKKNLTNYIVDKISEEFERYNPERDNAVIKLKRDLRMK